MNIFEQLLNSYLGNINACQAVADIVRTTLGPRGMDKLIYQGSKATISNDGKLIYSWDLFFSYFIN